MADNVELDAGSGGATIKTDDDGTAHWQYVKVAYGADNTQTRVTTAAPLPVDLRTDNLAGNIDVNIAAQTSDITIADGGNTITVDGTVTANLSATDNAVLDQIEVNTSYGDNTGGGTETGALRVTLANNSTGLLSVDDNGGSLTIDNSDITTIAGAVSGSEMQVDVVAALPAGTNVIGDVGLSGARTSGGTTIYRNLDVDESEDQVKGSAGQVYWLHAMNTTASPLYLKFYNATAASVTVGTTTPVLTFQVPTAGDTNGAGFNLSIPNGIAFSTAITVACTTALADADTGAPGANSLVLNMGYA